MQIINVNARIIDGCVSKTFCRQLAYGGLEGRMLSQNKESYFRRKSDHSRRIYFRISEKNSSRHDVCTLKIEKISNKFMGFKK